MLLIFIKKTRERKDTENNQCPMPHAQCPIQKYRQKSNYFTRVIQIT
ncbi:hypothetical protein [Nostoc linckia]|nr:hypothetical protein [Nostoc linckia]